MNVANEVIILGFGSGRIQILESTTLSVVYEVASLLSQIERIQVIGSNVLAVNTDGNF